MRVAVTGSSGQLGTQVLRRLIDDRAVKEIVALDLRPPRLVSRKLRAVQLDVRDPALAAARLRPSVLVGPGMDHPLGRALRRRLFPDLGAASLPLVWSEDAADAVLLALHLRARGAYNLSAGEQLPVSALCAAAGLRRVPV